MIKLYDGIIDLHNHSLFSDGEHSIVEIIQSAINAKISVVGITDHYEGIRNFKEYVDTLNEITFKFQGSLIILKGIELKATTFLNLSASDVLKINMLDYILIEDCEHYSSIFEFISKSEKILPHINIKIGIAHLDLMRLNLKYGLNGINAFINFLEREKIFLEINSNASNEFYDVLLYNSDKETGKVFDSIKKYKLEVSVGSDTHTFAEENYSRILRANQFVDLLVAST